MIEAVSSDLFINSNNNFEQLTTNFDAQINNNAVNNIATATPITDIDAPSFGNVLTSMVKGVDTKQNVAEISIRDLAAGKVNNIKMSFSNWKRLRLPLAYFVKFEINFLTATKKLFQCRVKFQ